MAQCSERVYTGKTFPRKYHGAIFSAQHGSWNHTDPVGAWVMVTYLKDVD
jgi:glucose/arabinose dehydrogenase